MITRRQALQVGGASFALLSIQPTLLAATDVIDITMAGRPDGSHVWFDPIGVHIQPGQTVRWTNKDAANAHTATAYHPDILDRPRRIPNGARPWDSGYLMPGESFEMRLTVTGVYDYYCQPHEHAGMVGRIVVGRPPDRDYPNTARSGLIALPDAALANFPTIADILASSK
ncbi:plastocyanin/azurin family copper-binding protein [Devosia rhodophyticola]|uniref:Plastocyanin/azurin family copper-binding protein n=1 Tax=Devosia rhodophyticola TaxID=3026423 RepID=A0ABY7YT21_9HYPH|nr:plastocyanin/azurin family copper-binding protein [Devosia rhodophyticola]WDR04533.1 plastocyanin/azurin family copper-binding protein [Devosia rhodophyticola]